MAHDEHFLQRLDRLSDEHLALALMLYREPVFVREAIDAAGIGTAPERVSIELTDRPLGPRVLVARDGAFVTCLSEGMANGPWPRIKRATLDAAIGRIERGRRLFDEAEKRSVPEWAAMLRRIDEAGPWMTREEIREYRVVGEVTPMHAPTTMLQSTRRWLALQKEIIDVPIGESLEDERMKAIWRLGWSLLHNASISAMSAKLVAELVAEEPLPHVEDPLALLGAMAIAPALLATEAGLFRSAQMTFRAGKVGLAALKHTMGLRAGSHLEAMTLLAGLTTHAAFGSKTRAEAEKYLRVNKPALDAPEPKDLEAALQRRAQTYRAYGGGLLDDMREQSESIQRVLRATAWSCLDAQARERFGRSADLPSELLIPLAAQSMVGFTARETAPVSMMLAPTIASAPPEELYLPAEHKKLAYAKFYEPEWLWGWAYVAEGVSGLHTKKDAKKGTVSAGRNALCACGSGKKFKRCCGK
jgi:hypothetical protein